MSLDEKLKKELISSIETIKKTGQAGVEKLSEHAPQVFKSFVNYKIVSNLLSLCCLVITAAISWEIMLNYRPFSEKYDFNEGIVCGFGIAATIISTVALIFGGSHASTQILHFWISPVTAVYEALKSREVTNDKST